MVIDLKAEILFDELSRRLADLPSANDNEAWRREFLINPVLTSPVGLGFSPSEIGAEISYPVSNAEYQWIIKNHGVTKNRVRPDYVIVPSNQELVAAVVEAKERQLTIESHLRHKTQLIIEQIVTSAPWGLLTDGERWTVFRGDDAILHLDSLDDLRKGMRDLRQLVGVNAVREQLLHKPTLTVILLSTPRQQTFAVDAEVFERLRKYFPQFSKEDFRVVSPPSFEFNSFSAAAGDFERWWWPSDPYFWPTTTRDESLSCFIDAYKSLGYEECAVSAREIGFQKIALFNNDGVPCHASYQLENGLWVSKLGSGEQIAHPLRAVEGSIFGHAMHFMRRKSFP